MWGMLFHLNPFIVATSELHFWSSSDELIEESPLNKMKSQGSFKTQISQLAFIENDESTLSKNEISGMNIDDDNLLNIDDDNLLNIDDDNLLNLEDLISLSAKDIEHLLNEQYNYQLNEQYNHQLGEHTNRHLNEQYNHPLNEHNNHQLGEQYNYQLGEQYNHQLGEQYNHQSNEQYNHPLNEHNNHQLGEQYNHQLGEQNNHPLNEHNNHQLGEQYNHQLGEQNKNQLNEQNKNQLNEQNKNQLNEHNNHQLNEQYNHQLNEQYNHQLNEQYNYQLGEQYNYQLGEQYNHQLNEQYNHQLNEQYNYQFNEQNNHQLNEQYNQVTIEDLTDIKSNTKMLNIPVVTLNLGQNNVNLKESIVTNKNLISISEPSGLKSGLKEDAIINSKDLPIKIQLNSPNEGVFFCDDIFDSMIESESNKRDPLEVKLRKLYSLRYSKWLVNVFVNCLGLEIPRTVHLEIENCNCIINNLRNAQDCTFDCRKQWNSNPQSTCCYNALQIGYLTSQINYTCNTSGYELWKSIQPSVYRRKRLIETNLKNQTVLKRFVFEKICQLRPGIDTFLVAQVYLTILSHPDTKNVTRNLCFLIAILKNYFSDELILNEMEYEDFLVNLFRCGILYFRDAHYLKFDPHKKFFNLRCRFQAGVANIEDFKTIMPYLGRFPFLFRYENYLKDVKDEEEVENAKNITDAIVDFELSAFEISRLILRRNGFFSN